MRTSVWDVILWTLVTALVVSTTARHAAAQTISWTRQLGTSEWDQARGVSADGMGNVYVGGNTKGGLAGDSAGGHDAFLGKYDASGTLLWAQQFGTDDQEMIFDVAADGLGSVYITPAAPDFLRKYDASGTVLWGEPIGTDWTLSIEGVSTDGLGNVYVAGGRRREGDGDDAFVSKYDATGRHIWTQQWGTDEYDDAQAVSPDSMGNVYVSGSTEGSLGAPNAGYRDGFLSKLDASGALVWTEQWGENGDEGAGGVSTDSLGNVYVASELRIIGSVGPDCCDGWVEDALLMKYDASGTLLWREQLDSGVGDVGRDVTTDGLGNVYLTGQTYGNLGGDNAGERDAFVSKYNTSGTPIWTQQWGSTQDEFVESLSADGLGSLYVTGYTFGDLAGENAGGAADMFLTQISDPTGDFDENGELNAVDIDLLSAAVRDGPYDEAFDLNLDTLLNEEDRRIWVEDIFGTFFGDANLNQAVAFDDFLALADAFGTTGGWAKGDFDGSADVQFLDFLRLAENFGLSAVEAAPTQVPEPSGFSLPIIVGVVLLHFSRALSHPRREV